MLAESEDPITQGSSKLKVPNFHHKIKLESVLINTKMNSIDAATYQNLITLSLLEAKDYGQAAASSLSAMAYLRTCESLNNGQSSLPSKTSGLSLDQCMLLSQGSTDDCIDASQMFIYDQGILIPQCTTDLAIITPILLFNSAVSQHLAAYARGSSTKDLESAKTLYNLAYGTQTVAHNKLFRFAVINNIAVIDRLLGNTETSDYYLRQLMPILMLMVDQKRDAELRQLRGFFANVRSITSCSAAGAA